MKWYYWVLVLMIAFPTYEMLREFGRTHFKRIFRATDAFIRWAAAWVIIRLMRTLRRLNESLHSVAPGDRQYAALTPTEHADESGVYENVLLSGLERPDVLNIGLSGPYGSGKSSILRTFMRRHPEYRCLNISLAAISSDVDNIAGKMKAAEVENIDQPEARLADSLGAITHWTSQLSEQIEYSILQQMFYHVRERHIPFSRFKRVRGTSHLSMLLLTVAMFLLLLASCYLFIFADTTPLPETWKKWLTQNDMLLRPLSWIALLTATLGVIFYILRLYHNAQLIKINVHSAQFEIAPKKDASALNKHLDEILYFFSEVPTDIVVIEDLDRFSIPEIFVKLREINTLINNAMEVGRKVTFLYALRDDVFTDENRTKFFDLIVPVIPLTNASNASAMLNREIAKMALPRPVPVSLLNDLGFFIQDTRLLYNITNELSLQS